jgi:hypothetical protein
LGANANKSTLESLIANLANYPDSDPGKLVPYDVHLKTKEERKHSESNQEKAENKKDQKENIVSKTASQVGGVVKQMVEAASSAVKQDKSSHSDDSDSERKNLS